MKSKRSLGNMSFRSKSKKIDENQELLGLIYELPPEYRYKEPLRRIGVLVDQTWKDALATEYFLNAKAQFLLELLEVLLNQLPEDELLEISVSSRRATRVTVGTRATTTTTSQNLISNCFGNVQLDQNLIKKFIKNAKRVVGKLIADATDKRTVLIPKLYSDGARWALRNDLHALVYETNLKDIIVFADSDQNAGDKTIGEVLMISLKLTGILADGSKSGAIVKENDYLNSELRHYFSKNKELGSFMDVALGKKNINLHIPDVNSTENRSPEILKFVRQLLSNIMDYTSYKIPDNFLTVSDLIRDVLRIQATLIYKKFLKKSTATDKTRYSSDEEMPLGFTGFDSSTAALISAPGLEDSSNFIHKLDLEPFNFDLNDPRIVVILGPKPLIDGRRSSLTSMVDRLQPKKKEMQRQELVAWTKKSEKLKALTEIIKAEDLPQWLSEVSAFYQKGATDVYENFIRERLGASSATNNTLTVNDKKAALTKLAIIKDGIINMVDFSKSKNRTKE